MKLLINAKIGQIWMEKKIKNFNKYYNNNKI